MKQKLKIQYCQYSSWNADLRGVASLFDMAKNKIEKAMLKEEPLSVSSPYEAEAAWLVARCMKIPCEFCEREGAQAVPISKDDFWRIFSSPLREFDLRRTEIEEWEADKTDTTSNPLGNWLEDYDD